MDSVRELKATLNEAIIKPMAASPVARAALGMAAQPMANAGGGGPTMALGIVRKSSQDYHLAEGLTFANPIDAVLTALKIELLFT